MKNASLKRSRALLIEPTTFMFADLITTAPATNAEKDSLKKPSRFQHERAMMTAAIATDEDIKETLREMGQAIAKQQEIVDAKKEGLKFEKKVLADLIDKLREFARDPDLPLFDGGTT